MGRRALAALVERIEGGRATPLHVRVAPSLVVAVATRTAARVDPPSETGDLPRGGARRGRGAGPPPEWQLRT
jgi:hypothetical protein